MKLTFSEEQDYLREAFGELFAKQCTPATVRAFRASPEMSTIQDLWGSLESIGFFGLAIPDEFGGQGAELFDQGIAYLEAGRALCPSPAYSTVAFGQALLRLGTAEQQNRWLPGIASGKLLGTVALGNPSDASDLTPRVSATQTAEGWKLDGTLPLVAVAGLADEVLVFARTNSDAGPAKTLAFIVSAGQAGWSVKDHQTFSRDSQGTIQLDGVVIADNDRVIGDLAAGLSGDQVLGLGNALTALQCMVMVGGTQEVIDRTVAYLKQREQFGRPLASFQAVQHHIADAHIALEGARLVSLQALWLTSEGQVAERETAIAKMKAGEAYKRATLIAHQLHGGMGYMREFDLHLWSENAKTTELRGGPAPVQRRRIERALGLAG